jgi:hypothetical protein
MLQSESLDRTFQIFDFQIQLGFNLYGYRSILCLDNKICLCLIILSGSIAWHKLLRDELLAHMLLHHCPTQFRGNGRSIHNSSRVKFRG